MNTEIFPRPPLPQENDRREADELAGNLRLLNSVLHALQGRLSGGLSGVGQFGALLDWGTHMANAPFHRAELGVEALRQWGRLAGVLASGKAAIEPKRTDYRFRDPAWQEPPFQAFAQAFLLSEQWWEKTTTGLPGVSAADERLVSFAVRQAVDAFSPSNVPWLNPEVIAATVEKRGENFLSGWFNMLTDIEETVSGRPAGENAFRVGRDLAATPGRVIFRNELIELIQYAPATDTVAPEPVLIVPAWIMKYYILDLSPHNSLIRYLVGRGYTVFAISWRNPDASMRNTSLDDYREKGLMAALDAVSDICGGSKVHACGYCLGGTLLSIGASAMARDGDDRLASVTLFCAQTDFTEAGELQLFITEDQLAFLGDVMRVQGYLDSRQMAGAFQLLRSNDLIWSRIVKTYLIGKREHPSDLMAWNADGTRMPARMHAEYLQQLFLDDALAEGHFTVEGRPVALNDIRLPFFVVGTETDHIAPWRSVYKLHLLNDSDMTFVLTTGGHNAGVVSEPGHPHRHYRIGRRPTGALYEGPDAWREKAELRDGSWWPAWVEWLDSHSDARTEPPATGSERFPGLEDAPGSYVHEQ